MRTWIKKTINPPGIDKPGRGSLFSVIGKVFDVVKSDALKAFNVHFPYLADERKLAEHGKALSAPRLERDSLEEFRDRVATSSFYHARRGERGYNIEQLAAHFGDRYVMLEEFLNVYVKILDLSEADRKWAQAFLDETVNPNVALTISEWFHFIETIIMQDSQELLVTRHDTDVFGSGLCCDGRFYCDQGIDILCDGEWECDGSRDCEGFQPARGAISSVVLADTACNGSWPCNGVMDCSGYEEIYSPVEIEGIPLYDCQEDELTIAVAMTPMEDSAVIDAVCDGNMVCDGRNLDSIIDAPMTMRIIRPFFCDGGKTLYATTLDGAILCDGSFACAEDGWLCADLIEEEEL